ncbi:MAG: hypothetical protein HUU15_12175 [Candidatus Brocadiae bacterium]|nr:hypothetical protein [Candidatus Brocadiia bacterium]
MKPLALLLLGALPASAQLGGSNLPNPTRLTDRKEFRDEGVSLQPPEGCVALASAGPDGQTVISVTRVVRVDGRDEPMGLQIEVIADLDFATYRRIAEAGQGAAGGTCETVDEAVRGGSPSWRADLRLPGQRTVSLLALDAGDRVVAVTWGPSAPVARECGRILADAVATLRVERRERVPAPVEPSVAWKDHGVALKHPDRWTPTAQPAALILRNPGDRFEYLAFGVMEGTVEATGKEWEAAKKRRGGPECLDGGEETFLGRPSFVFRCVLVHQGIEMVNETRVVKHRGKLFFAAFTARRELWEARREILDSMLATVALED